MTTSLRSIRNLGARSLGVWLAAGALAFIGTACAPTPLDKHWGDAYRANKMASIENPEAGSDVPVKGIDPVTGELVIENYKHTQKVENDDDPRRVFLIRQ